MKSRYTILDLPELAMETGDRLAAKDQPAFDLWVFQVGMRIRDIDLFVKLLTDVLDSMPPDVQDFWNGPCDCGERGLHSHN